MLCLNATSCPPEAATSCELFAQGGIYTRALECPAFATVWAAAASASKEDGNCWSLAMIEELMGQERFLVELKACVEQELNGHRSHRPVSLLRRDLPLAPFCFNAGLILSPGKMAPPGCSFPWDADSAGKQVGLGEIEACNASHAARGTGIAAQRARVHSPAAVRHGPKVPAKNRFAWHANLSSVRSDNGVGWAIRHTSTSLLRF